MQYVNLFRYNIPADNHYLGQTDRYINVIAQWNSGAFFNDGRPMCYCNPINMDFHDAISVKDWSIAYADIKRIAEQHFAELAWMERINQARAELVAAGEMYLTKDGWTDNPILARYEADLPTQQTLS